MSDTKQREAPAAIPVTPGVWVLPSQGNGFGVETPDGVVVVDTGPGGRTTPNGRNPRDRRPMSSLVGSMPC